MGLHRALDRVVGAASFAAFALGLAALFGGAPEADPSRALYVAGGAPPAEGGGGGAYGDAVRGSGAVDACRALLGWGDREATVVVTGADGMHAVDVVAEGRSRGAARALAECVGAGLRGALPASPGRAVVATGGR